MSDEIPFWRETINNSDHPLHNAAWLIFSERFKTEKVAKRLESQKQAVIDFCLKILDVDELRDGEALGGGYAVINSVRLLGKWQVVEAVPKMLQIVEEEHWDTIIADQTLVALEKMPPQIIDQLIDFGNKGDVDRRVTVSTVISNIEENEQVYDYVLSTFEECTDGYDIVAIGEMMIVHFPEKATPYLEEKVKNKKYREFREHFLGLIKEYQKGKE